MSREQARKFWTVGTLTAIIGCLPVLAAAGAKAHDTIRQAEKVPKLEETLHKISLDLQEIKTDIRWIKEQGK